MTAPSTIRRRAFTLIELIVVMSIIIMLASITVAYWPDVQNARSINNATDQLSQWLLTARQRAKRDGVATGLRLLRDPNTGLASQVQYIQQVDDLTGAQYPGSACQTSAGSAIVNFSNIDFIGGAAAAGQADQALVQQGDYLEILGTLYLITAPPTQTPGTMNPSVTVTPMPTVSITTTSFVIHRSPRPLANEETLTLPTTMVIDLTGTFNQSSLNVPQRTVNGVPFFEILFSPTGAVIGQGTSGGKVILWLRDSTPGASPLDPAALVTIQIRSGFIGASPINPPPGDPYAFTEDGRSSGM